MTKHWLVLLALASMLTPGCSSSDDVATATTSVPAGTSSAPASATAAPPATTAAAPTTPPTTPPTTAPSTAAPATAGTTTAPPAAPADEMLALVDTLASDELRGRQNLTPDADAARAVVLEALRPLAQPWNPSATGDDGYLQPFELGTNVVAVIPGTELPDEYVMVGAHLDHLGTGVVDDCRLISAEDDICNGAADNASGVAATLSIAARLAADPPLRSVIIAIWDAEEDGLRGSFAYAETPTVPLDRIVAYVNFDILGAWLLPSMANDTVVVGAETGGPALVDLVDTAIAGSTLDYASLSLLFGQGRSDHAPFAAAGVPVVFFTDANNGCYHTVDDEIAGLDRGKLAEQVRVAGNLVESLANGAAPIAFDATAPVTTFTDAERLLDLVREGEADFGAIDPVIADQARTAIATIESVVDAGAGAYDSSAEGALLGAAAQLVQLLAGLDCAFVTPG